jgi:hypothetical protein
MSDDPYSPAAREQVINREVANFQVRREQAWKHYIAERSAAGVQIGWPAAGETCWPPNSDIRSEAMAVVEAVRRHDEAVATRQLDLLRHAELDAPPPNPFCDEWADELCGALVALGEGVDLLVPEIRHDYAMQRELFQSDARRLHLAKDEDPGKDSIRDHVPPKAKRSTVRGEGQVKLIAALTKHHKYAEGGCLNQDPVSNNQLARQAKVSPSTASSFFRKQFGGHAKYRRMCLDSTGLATALKLINGEFAPLHLYGTRPPGEDEHEDED